TGRPTRIRPPRSKRGLQPSPEEGTFSMPSYTHNTPTPIDLAINWQVGTIEVIAGDRTDTIVTVSATNPEKAVDRSGAEETTVEFDGQRLTVTGPKPRISVFGPTESVDLKVELPTDSRLTAEIA